MESALRNINKNITFNLFGQALPLVVALFCVPPLLHRLGTDRFGVLAIAWAIVGYFGLFDFGMGRAVTQLIAAKRYSSSQDELVAVIGTSNALLCVLGVVATLTVLFVAPWFAQKAVSLPDELRADLQSFIVVLAVALPFVVLSSGLRGALEGLHEFRVANVIRAPFSALMYAGPLFAALWTTQLVWVAIVLVVVRVFGCLSYFIAVLFCLQIKPTRKTFSLDRFIAYDLMSFGGWLTVSNVIGPLLVYTDRFVIGFLVSASAVAFYVTPYEIASRMLFIGAAIAGVLYPAFATGPNSSDDSIRLVFYSGVQRLLLILLPIVVGLAMFAYPILRFWIGEELATRSHVVLQVIALGVWISSLTQIPYSLTQGFGRSDLTAKIHLVELPVYLVALWFSVIEGGIVGAAIAWTARVTVDLVLFTSTACVLTGSRPMTFRRFAAITLSTSAIIIASALAGNWLFV